MPEEGSHLQLSTEVRRNVNLRHRGESEASRCSRRKLLAVSHTSEKPVEASKKKPMVGKNVCIIVAV